jgi:hypothetical protein
VVEAFDLGLNEFVDGSVWVVGGKKAKFIVFSFWKIFWNELDDCRGWGSMEPVLLSDAGF